MERRVAGSSTGSVGLVEREEAHEATEDVRSASAGGKAEGTDPGALNTAAEVAEAPAAAASADVEAEEVAKQYDTETVSSPGKTKTASVAAARVRYQPVFSLEEAEKVDELMGPRPVVGEEGKTKPGLMPTARSKNDVFRMAVLITHRLLARQEEGFKLALVKDGEAKALELIV